MHFIVKEFDELTLDELYEILKICVNVFVMEQKYIYQELDDKDKQSLHLYFKDIEGIQAYLCVLPMGLSYKEASIGRVLTLKEVAI